jgi:hypothetical protein
MKALLKALSPYLRFSFAFPLHLAAAFIAAVAAEVLLTMQPMFLRAFIDEARNGMAARELWAFPTFMIVGALLAYTFDFISITIRYLLEQRLSMSLKDAYLEHGPRGRPEVFQLAMSTGISNLALLSLTLSVDVWLVLARIALVLCFLSFENLGLGLGVAAAMTACLGLNVATNLRIGRVSRAIQRVTTRIVALAARSGLPLARTRLGRLYDFDLHRFGLRSANVAFSFIMFKLAPLSVLIAYLLGAQISLGAIASTFLYFSMLSTPYQDLLFLLQTGTVTYSESALYREDVERSLSARDLLERVPVGLIWDRCSKAGGSPLSALDEQAPPPRELFDDLDSGSELKARRLRLLAKAAHEGSICIHGQDEALGRFVHFVSEEGGVRTAI